MTGDTDATSRREWRWWQGSAVVCGVATMLGGRGVGTFAGIGHAGEPDGGTAKDPADLTTEQRTSLAENAVTNKALYRAYLLKEQLREVFRAKGRAGRQLLAGWLSWASHSRIAEFIDLARSIRRYRDLIGNT